MLHNDADVLLKEWNIKNLLCILHRIDSPILTKF